MRLKKVFNFITEETRTSLGKQKKEMRLKKIIFFIQEKITLKKE